MRAYKQKVFYNPEITIPRLKEFKEEVISNSTNILLEQKYKNDVNHREPTDKSLEWILDNCNEAKDLRITKVYGNYGNEKDYMQVVFIKDWYFAWCDLPLTKLDYFIDKYKLEVL